MNPALCLLGLAAGAGMPAAEIETLPLFDFQSSSQAEAWRPVHDVVMGGVSSGRVLPGEGSVRFEGRVSLENNGGFASFRAETSPPDLTGFDGLRLRVRGDGLVYKLGLRTDGAWDGVSWQVPFAAPADVWSTVDIAFEDLVPTWRGRLVVDAPPFDPASIRQVGILIADKQQGPFALELGAIEAWRDAPPGDEATPPAGSRAAARTRTQALARLVTDGAGGAELLEQMRWSERLVVVAAPGSYDLDAGASRQIGRFITRGDDLAARDVRVVHLLGSRGGRLAGRTLSSDQVRELREAWRLSVGEWTLALVGKDGEVKAAWASLADPESVFERIDTMPLRAREADERRQKTD